MIFMKHVRFFTLLLLAVLVALAACAPADLDITPTPVPTPIPMIKVYITGAVAQTGTTLDLPLGSRVEDAIAAAGGATETADLQRVNLAQILRDGDQVNVPAQGDAVVEATPDVAAEAAAAEAAFNDPVAFLDRIVALVPTSFTEGPYNWQRDPNAPIRYATPRGGNTVVVSFIDRTGSKLEITYGIWPDAPGAQGFFDAVSNSLKTQFVASAENPDYPTPNIFGPGGTYGTAANFLRDRYVMRIAMPQRNTTTGEDPLIPLVEPFLSYLDQVLGG
jgi:SLBB domain